MVSLLGGGPRVVVSTAAFHARVRCSVPGLGGLKETKLFLPHPRVKVSIVGSLRDREVACSASDRQGSNFESCVWRTVSSQSSHHPQEVLLVQFSLYVHNGGLKPDSFHFCLIAGPALYPVPPAYSAREACFVAFCIFITYEYIHLGLYKIKWLHDINNRPAAPNWFHKLRADMYVTEVRTLLQKKILGLIGLINYCTLHQLTGQSNHAFGFRRNRRLQQCLCAYKCSQIIWWYLKLF